MVGCILLFGDLLWLCYLGKVLRGRVVWGGLFLYGLFVKLLAAGLGCVVCWWFTFFAGLF